MISVYGSTGFIGSHIVDRLIEDGNEVISLDNEEFGGELFKQSKQMIYEKIRALD